MFPVLLAMQDLQEPEELVVVVARGLPPSIPAAAARLELVVVLVQPALALQQDRQEQMDLAPLMQPQEIQEQLVMQELRLLQPGREQQEQMDLVQLMQQQETMAMRVVRELRLHS